MLCWVLLLCVLGGHALSGGPGLHGDVYSLLMQRTQGQQQPQPGTPAAVHEVIRSEATPNRWPLLLNVAGRLSLLTPAAWSQRSLPSLMLVRPPLLLGVQPLPAHPGETD